MFLFIMQEYRHERVQALELSPLSRFEVFISAY